MRIFSVLLVLCLLAFSHISYAKTPDVSQSQESKEIHKDIDQLKQDVKNTAHDVEIIRRDQTNYSIEKSLLKEAYSSNLERINIVITVVFGIFGIIGFLGIRSIKEIKTDYTNELDKLRALRNEFESELNSLKEKQHSIEDQLKEIGTINSKQENRLELLELIEKASSIIQSGDPKWALEYISVGLRIDPNNSVLWKLKTACHGKLGEIIAAIESNRKILELEPENLSTVTNLLELLALTKQKDEFDAIYRKHKESVDARDGGALATYLKAILKFMIDDIPGAIEDLKAFAKGLNNEAKQHLGSWRFDEILAVTSKLAEGKQKDLMSAMVNFFKGTLQPNEFITTLGSLA